MPTEYPNGRVIVDITPQQQLSNSLVASQQATLDALELQVQDCIIAGDEICAESWNDVKTGIKEGIAADLFVYLNNEGGEFISNVRLHTSTDFVRIGLLWHQYSPETQASAEQVMSLPNYIEPWTSESPSSLEGFEEEEIAFRWTNCADLQQRNTIGNAGLNIGDAIDNIKGEGGEPVEGVWVLQGSNGGAGSIQSSVPEEPNIVFCNSNVG